jgi:hypothetical protein
VGKIRLVYFRGAALPAVLHTIKRKKKERGREGGKERNRNEREAKETFTTTGA